MKAVSLISVAEVTMGTAPPGETYNGSGYGMPMIAGAGDYGEMFPRPKKWTTAPTRVAKSGDLIVCVRATIGDLNWADRDYCLGRGVAGIRARHGKADVRYLAHFMESRKSDLARLGTGSTFLAIRRADLEQFSIPLPPLPEQKRIAAILDKADAIRRKRQQAIQLTEQFLRSTFLDMFGDPVTNPKGWRVVELGTLVSRGFQNGAYYPKEQYVTSGGVEMVHMSDAFYGSVTFDEIKRVSAPESDVEKYSLDHNDILVARRSLNYEGSAKPCRIPKTGRDLIFESSLIRVTTDREKLHPLYFYYYLSNPRARSKYVFKQRYEVDNFWH